MTIKHIFSVIFLFIIATNLVACSKEEDIPPLNLQETDNVVSEIKNEEEENKIDITTTEAIYQRITEQYPVMTVSPMTDEMLKSGIGDATMSDIEEYYAVKSESNLSLSMCVIVKAKEGKADGLKDSFKNWKIAIEKSFENSSDIQCEIAQNAIIKIYDNNYVIFAMLGNKLEIEDKGIEVVTKNIEKIINDTFEELKNGTLKMTKNNENTENDIGTEKH